MTDTAVQTPRVLVLCSPDAAGRELVEQFVGDAAVRIVHSFTDAVQLIGREQFDLVVSQQGDFVALERAASSAQSSAILETLGQGVCIVDQNGHVSWSNPVMQAHSAELLDMIRERCQAVLSGDADADHPARPRYFSLRTSDDCYFEITATPILDSDKRATRIAAVAWDITRARRQQRKIDAIDMAGRELVGLDRDRLAEMNIEDRLVLLEETFLKHLHDLMHFDNFAVLLLDRKTNRLEMVLRHGMREGVDRLDIHASPVGNGISGYVAATGRSYICPDTKRDARYLPGLDQACSSLTVPLRLNDQVVGILDIESEQPAAFTEDDRQFAEILGRYVAMALNVLDLLITERFTTTGQFAKDVTGEIAAPLNDILVNATTLMEEYIGHDDLRQRLGAICDQVTSIRSRIREVAEPRGGILGFCRSDPPKDPVLSGKRILVADDEEIIRETISAVLSNYGCDVETACDGNEAVAMLEARSYDLLLADIKMPGKNGYEVFAAFRDHHDDQPVILITGFGYDPNHSIVRARREGLAAVLFKPFKVDQLLDEVRQALQPAAESR
ncbi:MAG: response regulator [Phycisphaerae bacterium]